MNEKFEIAVALCLFIIGWILVFLRFRNQNVNKGRTEEEFPVLSEGSKKTK